MPIACTRCGKKQEGEILTSPVTFTFKHEKGWGMGIGPLAVIKGQIKKPKTETSEFKEVTGKSNEIIITDEAKPKEIKVEVKEPKKEKTKVFGNNQ